jgi:putative transposase
LGERKEIVCRMVSLGMPTSKALSIAWIPRSTYYYKATGSRKGKVPSTRTWYKGKWVDNKDVIKSIEELLEPEFIDYGYVRTAQALKKLGYTINKKKVYRLMKEHHLLYPKKRPDSLNKVYVQDTTPICKRPFEVIETDIKYVYIHGQKKFAYLITLLDVFSRMALVWDLCWTMKAADVLALLNSLYSQWLIPCNIDPAKMTVKIRTDNGSQFVARLFREHLSSAHIQNEYIRPGTPQQNAHIESFHSTVKNLVCGKYEFENYDEAKDTFKRFFYTYNHRRIMKEILYCSPVEFMQHWANGKVGLSIEKRKVKYYFREKPSNLRSEDSCSETFIGQNKINELIYRHLTIN